MAINSRNKGRRGESLAASMFREYGYDVHRTAQRTGMTGTADIEGAPYLHIEVKNRERLNPWDAISQANRDSRDGEIPCVMWKKNNCSWLVVMEFDEWIKFYQAYEINRKETEDLMSLPFTEE